MFTYTSGCLIAFIWAVYILCMDLWCIYGQAGQNMRRVGMYYSIWTNKYGHVANDGPSKNPGVIQWSLWIISTMILGTLASWLTVIWGTIAFLIQMHKQSGMPESIKKYRWSIRNLDLDRIQLLNLGLELDGITKEQKKESMLRALKDCTLEEFNEQINPHGYPKDPVARDYMSICEIKPSELLEIRKWLMADDEFRSDLEEIAAS